MSRKSTPLKIAVVVPYKFLPVLNGGHRVCFDLCQYLSRKIDVYCISTFDNILKVETDFHLKSILPNSKKKYFSPIVGYRIYRFLKKEKVNVCIVNHPFIGLITYLPCRLSRTSFVVYCHNDEHKRFTSLKKKWSSLIYLIEWLVYRLADLIFFISLNELHVLSSRYRINPHRCSYLPHMLRLKETPSRTSDPTQTRIVYYGDYSYKPNEDTLKRIVTQILPILHESIDKPYVFQFFGTGLSKSLESMLDTRRYNVEYLGFVPDVYSALLLNDIFLNPILYDAGGVQTKTIEALSAGVTVISSSAGARGLSTSDCGTNLILIPDEDWQGYVDSILTVSREKTIKRTTNNTFYETYYWENVVDRVVSRLSFLHEENEHL